MPTLDEEIGRQLEAAAASGELRRAGAWGKPLPEMPGWHETPEPLRMPFKILKDAGIPLPEIAWFHERARLRAALDAAGDATQREALQRRLVEVEQRLALRLDALRRNASL